MIFTDRIEKLLASNHIKEVIDEFLKFLSEVPQSAKDARSDANQLRGQVILLSGQFADLNTKINNDTIDPSLANRERSIVTNSFIQILNQLPSNYTDLNNYITEKNEDDEWKEAQQKNTIDEYQDYFSKYPNGRYKAETIKLMEELKEVKQKQDEKIKKLAEDEKKRREDDKVVETETQKPAYIEQRTNQAYRSSNSVIAHPPAKSRTGLYIALGALLGILFIIIIAVAVSGDEPSPVAPQPYKPAATLQWTQADENNFLIQCQNSVVNIVGADRAVPYCDCVLQKMKAKYASYEEANAKVGSMTQDEITAMGVDCLK